MQTCDRQRHPLGAWITKLEQRMHRSKVVVALANPVRLKTLPRPSQYSLQLALSSHLDRR
jgi:hypothetical protein